MRLRLLAVLFVAMACSSTSTAPSPSVTASAASSATSSPQVTATSVPSPTLPPTPTPIAAPLPPLAVKVTQGSFGIVTDLVLKPAAVDEQLVRAASTGVAVYLNAIDLYRNGLSPALPITGPFLAAVSAALKDSATPGVQRKFELLSLKVDRHLVKPWGTHAYVDVTVSIADRAVGGTAPDQFETGQLRLMGDRFRVTDAWDEEHGRWFNGFRPLALQDVRDQVGPAVDNYLRMESWSPTAAPLDWRTGSDALPFLKARAATLNAIDRTRVASRLFEGTTATIERFDTIEGLWSGLATVRLNGTLAIAGPDGKAQRTAFERRVKVFMFGSWMPAVVDEEVGGVWLSGGDLALDQVDVDRA